MMKNKDKVFLEFLYKNDLVREYQKLSIREREYYKQRIKNTVHYGFFTAKYRVKHMLNKLMRRDVIEETKKTNKITKDRNK